MSELARQLITKEIKKRTGKLDLGNCGLTDLEKEVPELFDCVWLEELNLTNRWLIKGNSDRDIIINKEPKNKISNIPLAFQNLLNLKSLKIGGFNSKNKWEISDITPLKELTNLQSLVISASQVSDINYIENLTNLKSLDLRFNLISDISPLKELTNLQSLVLCANQISDISYIENLTNLQSLDLRFNLISDISSLEKLINLQSLNLGYNQISDIHYLLPLLEKDITITTYQFGDGINIHRNPLTTIPIEIVQWGNKAIINYLKQLEDQGGTEPLYEARLLIVGEPGAGKTSLMKKLIDPSYRVMSDNQPSTTGVNIYEGWKFPYQPKPNIFFSANLWDFGGQEIQYMTHQFFLSPRSLYLLVADDRKQHTNFPYWFDVIHLLGKRESGQQSPILVMLNEINHQSISNYDHAFFKERYPNTLLEKREVDLSKDDGRFIALRSKIQEMLCQLEHVGDGVPKLWRPIRNKLKERVKVDNYITEEVYFEICKKVGLKNEEDCLLLSGYLHDLGILLHYQHDSVLQDFIILNPHWAVEAVYSVLSDDRVKRENGCFTVKYLAKIWKEYSRLERSRLLSLMKKNSFEICYEIKDDHFIAPQLLPNIQPEYSWNGKDSLKFRYKYEFMPKGILARLIVRIHQYIYKQDGIDVVWEKGVVLKRGNCLAQIIEDDYKERILDIEVSGNSEEKRYVMSWIREEVMNIHKKWFRDKLDFDRLIPCNCEVCRVSEHPFFFPSKRLEKFFGKGKQTDTCGESVQDVKILELLEGIFVQEEVTHVTDHSKGEFRFKFEVNNAEINKKLDRIESITQRTEYSSITIEGYAFDILNNQQSLQNALDHVLQTSKATHKDTHTLLSKIEQDHSHSLDFERLDHFLSERIQELSSKLPKAFVQQWQAANAKLPHEADAKWKLKFKIPFLFGQFEKELSWDAKTSLKLIRQEIMAYQNGKKKLKDLFIE